MSNTYAVTAVLIGWYALIKTNAYSLIFATAAKYYFGL